jgi:hypothetical protein
MDYRALLPWVAFGLVLAVYAVTRLFALDSFPIYFFTDEAVGPVLGVDLIHNGFKDSQGNLFPPYFQNGTYWNLSLSVYIHALTAGLLGKSIIVTRATSALISLSGAAAVGLIMKLIFKLQTWWVVGLLLAVTPAWFLHSRTAFETVMMVSFYCWFLLFYLLYRYRSPRFLYPALVCAAAAFYAYANGQLTVGFASLLLLIVDWPYHVRHRRTGLFGLGLVAVLAVPYVRFRIEHPYAMADQLRTLGSYWIEPISLPEKLKRLASTYLYGLSPQYWFAPNEQDPMRHRMKGYGNISLWILPFLLIGIVQSARNIKSPAHRALFITAAVAPLSSALVDIAITRALLFVVPANMFAAIGIDTIISQSKAARLRALASVVVLVSLSAASLFMLDDALTNGPLWYQDYGLYGMQWGARQLYQDVIPAYMRAHPQGVINVASTWTNGADVVEKFFDLPPRVVVADIYAWLQDKLPLDGNDLFILPPDEYALAKASHKFKSVDVVRIIYWPNGQPGFYLVHLAYIENIEAIFAEQRRQELQPVVDHLKLDGQVVTIAHTRFDMGGVQEMFDHDHSTVARGIDVNPLSLDFTFAKPRAIRRLTADFGTSDSVWTVVLFGSPGSKPVRYVAKTSVATARQTYEGAPIAGISVTHGPSRVVRMHMTVWYPQRDPREHVHIFEMELR